MPMTYDIETDYLYNKGKDDTRWTIITEMLKDPAMTVGKIAKFTHTSADLVKEVSHSLK